MQIKFLADLVGIVDNTPPKFHYYKRMRDYGMINIFTRPFDRDVITRHTRETAHGEVAVFVKDPAVDATLLTGRLLYWLMNSTVPTSCLVRHPALLLFSSVSSLDLLLR
jgi:hypothetical protein